MSSAPDLPNIGYVYIMSNPTFQNDIRKIGCTFGSKSPQDRANELNTTGVPSDFTLERWFFVEDSELIEQLIHKRLDHVRVNGNKEFFRISLEDAMSTISQAQRDVQSQIWSGNYTPNITHKSINALKSNAAPRKQVQAEPVKVEASIQQESSVERLKAQSGAPLILGNNYSNPKFPKMLLLLAKASAEGNNKLYSVERLAKDLEISQQGVEKLIQMAQSQKIPLIFEGNKRYENRYGINIQVKKSLTLLKETFPNCNFGDFENFLINSTPETKKRSTSAFIPRSPTNDARAVESEEDIFSQLGNLSQESSSTPRKPRM